ncbi:hypothetical protein O3M35_004662 [Rhynocoris fuscipes]|uniref:Uncharacterized protein n=1 Tax=Rhynocoris fuscipes TaxID=488301 RepID=A0AAW1CFD8_9HEMI
MDNWSSKTEPPKQTTSDNDTVDIKKNSLEENLSKTWSQEERRAKYGRSNETLDIQNIPITNKKMSSMEEESVRDRLRLKYLGCLADHISTAPRYTKDSFRKTFLNKVSIFILFFDFLSL